MTSSRMMHRLLTRRPILAACALSTLCLSGVHAQTVESSPPEFEVASIRPVDPNGPRPDANLDLDASDYLRYTGGVITANGPLVSYILFAYKIMNASDYPAIDKQLTGWAHTEQFHLEARGGDHPTKDHIRTMMQALLADRFGLKLHQETKQLPVYGLVLAKSAKPHPQLKPHEGDPVCSTVSAEPKKTDHPTTPAPYCGTMAWNVQGQLHLRIMDYTLDQIAGQLALTGPRMGDLESIPILDQTGLQGRYDLEIQFRRKKNPSATNAEGAVPADPDADDPAPDFVQALKAQAGLELRKQTGPVVVMVIDHINPPSPN